MREKTEKWIDLEIDGHRFLAETIRFIYECFEKCDLAITDYLALQCKRRCPRRESTNLLMIWLLNLLGRLPGDLRRP